MIATLILLVSALATGPAAGQDGPPMPPSSRAVILLHGLGRTPRSMAPLARALRADGATVLNLRYPSRRMGVEDLEREFLKPALARADLDRFDRVDVVTHSLGGILWRVHVAANGAPAHLGRVVMLAPPNQGSEVADRFRTWPLFRWALGPAFLELGTGPDALPRQLPAPEFELGVLAGRRSADPWFAWCLPSPHDGKVSVASTRVEGMADHRVLDVSHPFIMRHPEAIRLTRRFLAAGTFADEAAPSKVSGSPPRNASVGTGPISL